MLYGTSGGGKSTLLNLCVFKAHRLLYDSNRFESNKEEAEEPVRDSGSGERFGVQGAGFGVWCLGVRG